MIVQQKALVQSYGSLNICTAFAFASKDEKGHIQRHILRDRRPSTATCPACWAMGTKKLRKCTANKKIFCAGPFRAAKAEQNLLYRHDKPHEPTKKGPLSFVLFESPFTSVSTVSRGHPSLQSLWAYHHGFSCIGTICVAFGVGNP